MVLDILFFLIAAYCFLLGYRKGVIQVLLAGFSILIGLVVAVQYTSEMNVFLIEFFQQNNQLMPFISFFFTFFVAMVVIRIAAQLAEAIFKTFELGAFNQIAGGFLAALAGLFLYSGILWFLIEADVLNEAARAKSRTLPYVNIFLEQYDVFVQSISKMVEDLSKEMQNVLEQEN
jgi:uncharacterized membrane protein required for colicin V production